MKTIMKRQHLPFMLTGLVIGILGVLLSACGGSGGSSGGDGTPALGTTGSVELTVDWTNVMISALRLETGEINEKARVPGGTSKAVVTITGPDMDDMEMTLNAAPTLTLANVPAGANRTIKVDGFATGPPEVQTHTGSVTGVTIVADKTNKMSITVRRLASSGGEGDLHVTTILDAAAFKLVCSGGAKYSGRGRTWTQSGAMEGNYTVTFSDVGGYIAPDEQTGYLEEGGSLTFDGQYVTTTKTGTITVTTNIDEASFSIAGPQGATYAGTGKSLIIRGAPAGEYTITYAAVDEYNPPADDTKALAAGETIAFSGSYTAALGSISVSTNLDDASFTISGPNGVSYSGRGRTYRRNRVPDGSYTITYGEVTGYTKPADETAAVVDGAPITFTGTYTEPGGTIQVTTNLDDAEFTIIGPGRTFYEGRGKTWTQTGAPVGEYTISYEDVDRYTTPADETATLVEDGSLSFTGTYVEDFGWYERVAATQVSTSADPSERPGLAVDPSGNVFVSWHDNGGDEEVFFSALRRSDLTSVYGPIRLTDDDAESQTTTHGIAIDKNADVFVVWQDARDGNDEIYFGRADGTDGDGMVTEKRVSNDAGSSMIPAVAMDEHGDVHVVWQDDRDGNQEIYYVKLSDYTGNQLFAPVRVTNDAGNSVTPAIVLDEDNNVHIVWSDDRDGNYDLFYAQLSGADGSVNVAPVVLDNTAAAERLNPAIAVSGTSRVLIAYQNDNRRDYDINLMRIATWNGAVSFNRAVVDGSSESTHPDLVLRDADHVFVVWTDDHDHNDEIYIAKFDALDGDELIEPQRITDDDDDSDYASIGIDVAGNLYIAWQDDRSGDFQVYITKGVMVE